MNTETTIYCLYIEPDEQTLSLVKKHFKDCASGLSVKIDCAKNVDLGLQTLREKTYDLILTDLHFPDCTDSPVTIIKKIQKLSQAIPLVAIYELPQNNLQKELFDIGVYECINLASALMQPELIKHRFSQLLERIHMEKELIQQINLSQSIISEIVDIEIPNKQSQSLKKGLEIISQKLVEIKDQHNNNKEEHKQIMSAFSMYVDPKIINEVILGGEAQVKSGQLQDITVLFSDLRGYTRMSSKMEPNDIVSFLNEYYTAMTEVVMGYNGMVDKYMGDGIMCIFGAPVEDKNHVVNAIEAAMEMQSVFELWQKSWKENYNIKPKQGIGLACGETVVGNLGSFQKTSYTAIGSAVNLAARLESVAESGDIVISKEMHTRLEKAKQNTYNFEALAPIGIRGMDGRQQLYRLTKEIDLDDILVENT